MYRQNGKYASYLCLPAVEEVLLQCLQELVHAPITQQGHSAAAPARTYTQHNTDFTLNQLRFPEVQV